MKIRVAYDISVLGTYFSRVDSKHGVVRVIEELLFELLKRDDIDLTAIGLCGDDPLLSSVNSYVYTSSLQGREPFEFRHSFKSRLGLERLYQSSFSDCLTQELGQPASGSWRSFSARRVRGMLYRLYYIHGIDRLYPVFDQKRYDVFHSPFLKLPERTLTGSVPRILTIYDLIPLVAPEFVTTQNTINCQGRLDSLDIERDWVACISEHTKNVFCDYMGMAPERVFVTPLAVSADFRPVTDDQLMTSVRQRYGVPEGNFFLSVAAPQPRKNLVHLIRSFFRLLNEHQLPDTYLVLAGSKELGWMYDEIFESAESSSNHTSRVIFTGYVADEDLAALYSGALAFVYPSLYEGFGLPALEAMACATPVITSNTTALPEVVGDAALLVDPQDEDELCQAMLRIAEDSELRSQLRRKGLKRVAEFSWKRCAQETARAYHAAASERAEA
jgi:glycosyltransferase involved in cell wall biosynthesis